MDEFIFILELIGTVAFASSGAMIGIEKKMDIFGVNVLGATTAVGGGIMRDIILGLTDYPVYGEKVGNAVAGGEADLGLAICGTGVGISLACNKVKGIRACVCSEPYTAKLSRVHNNSNVLAFGARVVGSELAKMITEAWLDAEFEGGRHERRVNMIMEIENR